MASNPNPSRSKNSERAASQRLLAYLFSLSFLSHNLTILRDKLGRRCARMRSMSMRLVIVSIFPLASPSLRRHR